MQNVMVVCGGGGGIGGFFWGKNEDTGNILFKEKWRKEKIASKGYKIP